MNPFARLRGLLWLVLMLVAAAAVQVPLSAAAEGVEAPRARPKILVMLHRPLPHYRPDASYGGVYEDRLGQAALRRVALELARDYGMSLGEDWPMPALGVDCFVMNLEDSEVPQVVAERVSHDARAAWAQTLNDFHGLERQNSLYAVQPTARIWHLEELHRLATGRGVRVAVIDSAVDVHHPDLAGQLIQVRNFVDSRPDVAEAHGTGVAGIIVARSTDGSGIVGVAPGVVLLALRACWEEGEGTTCNSLTLAKALQFAIDARAQVINLSWGGPADPLIDRLLGVALGQGATVVSAFDDRLADGGFPASRAGVVAVSDRLSSALGGSVLVAPGMDIPAPAPGGRWRFVSGSSYAAADASGMIALLLEVKPEAFASRPVSWVLFPLDSANGLAGGIDACATLARATLACSCLCPGPQSLSTLR